MSRDLLQELEKKVEHALGVIEILRLQLDELEEENTMLKVDHEKWREHLSSLIDRFDSVDVEAEETSTTAETVVD